GGGPETTTTSCRGYVRRSTRAVAVTGPMSFRPDAARHPYFGTISGPGALTGTLTRTVVQPHRGGCGPRHRPSRPCRTGQDLVAADPTGMQLVAAGVLTDQATDSTTGLVEAFTVDFKEDAFVVHDTVVRTPDSSW